MTTLTAVEESFGVPDVETDPTAFTVPSDVLTEDELIRGYVFQIHRNREHAVRRDSVDRDESLTPGEKTLNS
jgi:hypothetical protein